MSATITPAGQGVRQQGKYVPAETPAALLATVAALLRADEDPRGQLDALLASGRIEAAIARDRASRRYTDTPPDRPLLNRVVIPTGWR